MIKEYLYHYEIMNNDFTTTLGRKNELKIHRKHEEEGWRVTLCDTGDKAQKGARLKRVEKYVDGPVFMVTYGDGLTDVNIRALMQFHLEHGKLATVTGVRPLARFGELTVQGQQVKAFREKPQSTDGLISGGFFVFNRDLFNYLEDKDDCDLEYGALEQIAGKGELMVYDHPGFWACMDNIRDMEYLNRLWESGQAGWKIW
jgi:glucose-1-phosphate cytidylyltransferase